MSRIFVTGDTHGEMSMKKLSNTAWPTSKELTRDDYVIIAGDFGLLFYNEQTPAEKWWLEWLNDRPFTTLVVDGNHENFNKLNSLPIISKFDSEVGQIAENIFHLRRGNVYNICGKKFFTMGGAESIDKERRVIDVSWWKEELPSYEEFERGLSNLEKHNNEVDYIIGHNCPQTIAKIYLAKYNQTESFKNDSVSAYFDNIVQYVKFKDFYFGHWHDNWTFGKYHMLYEKIEEIVA